MTGLKSQGYLKSKLCIFFSKPSLHVSYLSETLVFSPKPRVWGLLSSYPPSLSWPDIITLTFLKSVPFSILTALAHSSASLVWTETSIFLGCQDHPSQPKPAKSLAVPGSHRLLFHCQILTHVFVSLQMTPVPLSARPYFLSKAVALFSGKVCCFSSCFCVHTCHW